MLYKRLQALFHPERYHGWGRTRKYFEGWYFKVISANEQHAYAFIPGIAMDAHGMQQAFIQVLDGKKQTAEYHTFPAQDFVCATSEFRVQIQNNVFTSERIILNLPGISGTLDFKGCTGWPNSWNSPGIMGPYAFAPFMECYHGIVSLHHTIKGSLLFGKQNIEFSDGVGYTEKDWGHSFPSAYIWMQSNHFSQPGISLKISVAKIPWLRSSFVGFIAGFYINKKLIQFTTYNGTQLLRSVADKNNVEIVLQNKQYRLEIFANRHKATSLAAPISGFMDGRIAESMTSELDLKLINVQNNKVVFADSARNVALEVAGNIDEITTDKQ